MNYSYGQYPYYNNGFQQQQYYGNGTYQQQYVQPQQLQQTNYFPLTYVSGIEGAKAFIVQPNTTFYLLDSENSEKLYIKSADKNGRYSLITKRIIDDETPNQQNNSILQDFSRLEEKIDKIYEKIMPKGE